MPRDIQIHPVLNGFVCNVGCQIVVFHSAREVATQLIRYYEAPEKTEKEYIEAAVNKTVQTPAEPVPATPAGCITQAPPPPDQACGCNEARR